MSLRKLAIRRPSPLLLVTLLVLVVMLMFALSRCSRPVTHVPGFVKPGGDTLCVAIELSPMAGNIGDGDTELTGYYYDVIQTISRQQSRPMVVVPVSLAEGLDGLDAGMYDVLIADIPATVSRKRHYLFTDPLYRDRQVLVQKRLDNGELRYKSLFDLGGEKLYIPHGSAFETRINNLADEIGDTIIVVEDESYGQEAMIMMTMAGEIPNAVVNERQAMAMADDYPQLDCSLVLSLNQLQSWVINKGDSVTLETLNRYIREFKASSEYHLTRP